MNILDKFKKEMARRAQRWELKAVKDMTDEEITATFDSLNGLTDEKKLIRLKGYEDTNLVELYKKLEIKHGRRIVPENYHSESIEKIRIMVKKYGETKLVELYKKLEADIAYKIDPENYHPRQIFRCFLLLLKELKKRQQAADYEKKHPKKPTTEAEWDRCKTVISSAPWPHDDKWKSLFNSPMDKLLRRRDHRISEPGERISED